MRCEHLFIVIQNQKGIHLDLDTWIVPGQTLQANLHLFHYDDLFMNPQLLTGSGRDLAWFSGV